MVYLKFAIIEPENETHLLQSLIEDEHYDQGHGSEQKTLKVVVKFGVDNCTDKIKQLKMKENVRLAKEQAKEKER